MNRWWIAPSEVYRQSRECSASSLGRQNDWIRVWPQDYPMAFISYQFDMSMSVSHCMAWGITQTAGAPQYRRPEAWTCMLILWEGYADVFPSVWEGRLRNLFGSLRLESVPPKHSKWIQARLPFRARPIIEQPLLGLCFWLGLYDQLAQR